MPVKMKYSSKQRLLGVFVDGLAKDISEIPKTPKEIADQPVERSGRGFYSRTVLGEGEYAYNDMVNQAVSIVWFLNGMRVLVCPQCKSVDVEPVFSEYHESHKRPDDKLLFEDKASLFDSTFAECPRCKACFFLPELVSQKSFRLVLPKEDASRYFPYLTCVWLEGQWRVLLGESVRDASGSATGKSWIDS